MKKRWPIVLFFLAVTVMLALLWPFGQEPKEEKATHLFILRVWNGEKEPAVAAWLKGRARAYEKETGVRVYLRLCSRQDLEAALSQEALPPDLLVSSSGGAIVALRGYALIVRDDQALFHAPSPTGLLFFRPSPTPGPTPEPLPWPQENELSAVLSPNELMGVLPGTVFSQNPAGDFSQGKARAALLTPGQAVQLALGFRACALPEEKGLLPVRAAAASKEGEAFLLYLLSPSSQQALAQHGLFSPSLRLYQADDPLRFLIDSSREKTEEKEGS